METLSPAGKLGRFLLGAVISILYYSVTNLSYRFFDDAASNYIAALWLIIYLAGIIFVFIKSKIDLRYKYIFWGLLITPIFLLLFFGAAILLLQYIVTNIS